MIIDKRSFKLYKQPFRTPINGAGIVLFLGDKLPLNPASRLTIARRVAALHLLEPTELLLIES